MYEKDGELIAEDEEGCFDEYKKKGLLAKSADHKCQSPFHNSLTPAVTLKAYNWTAFAYNGTWSYYDMIVIAKGTIVHILATRCDGTPECSNREDENNCGYGTLVTGAIGKSIKLKE